MSEANPTETDKQARIAAFGAMRSAVRVARWYDDVAKGTNWLTPEYIESCKESARATRWAIRVAIGSENAPGSDSPESQ